MVHPANGTLRESDGAEYDNHELNTVQLLTAVFVGQVAENDHAHSGASESQGIDGDLNIGLMFRAPVHEGQTWQNYVGGEKVVGIGKEAGGSDSPDAPVEAMLVYYGDKLFALTVDGRDVAGVFGRVKGPCALLQMEMWTMRLGRLVRRGHREAGTRRCREERLQAPASFRSGDCGRSSPSRSDASAAWHSGKGGGGARDGDFSSETNTERQGTIDAVCIVIAAGSAARHG